MPENPMTEAEVKLFRKFLKPFSKLNCIIYQWTNGRLMGRLKGRPIMLVTMTGAKTGKKRTIPLMYVPYKEGVIVVASQGGSPRSPVWYRNLVADPDVVVQYRSRKINLRAREIGDEERVRVWPVCVEHYHEYDDYQKRTDRKIPVFVCEPR
jgi:deazaflavin-dependent oxidoreductase (nitroreductase family)